ncbi:MBL fold metallo-hydrolase [Zestomonas carbonaria]|uniref:Ribonuclease BN n=1 Tax=Zestomonas carbonaria TaxID=2762745 RepID=A0A7U7EQ94_9GAMM|nr:MBL fold metallo-hydrolase [Pseudomonas carbonaria]CAD5109203.1 Ribonuclease BN [Pseudomonas carbonaria]
MVLMLMLGLGLPLAGSSGELPAPPYKTLDLRALLGDRKSPETKIVFLGTGTPILERNTAGQSIAIIVRGEVYLFDAGHGALNNLSNYDDGKVFPPARTPAGYMGTPYMDKLFLTHLDSDHVLDVPEFLLRFWIYGRARPAQVHGPEGTAALVQGVLQGNRTWIDYRLAAPRTKNQEGISVRISEFSAPGLLFADENVRVSSFPVVHGSWEAGKTWGYRVETPDLVISITGDYSYRLTPTLRESLAGSDIVISEIMSEEGVGKLPRIWRDYMLDAHTTEDQLAALMDEVKPRLLVGTHVLPHGTPRDAMVARMNERYGGNFILAEDNLVLQ